MEQYFLHNPDILDFINYLEFELTPVRNELMAQEIIEKAVLLLDSDSVDLGSQPESLVKEAKNSWLLEQERLPGWHTIHDPIRFQLVMYLLNGIRIAQVHTSRRGTAYLDALETLDSLDHTEEDIKRYYNTRETPLIQYDMRETLNPYYKAYDTPEFYENMIGVQPQRHKRLLNHIKNRVNSSVLRQNPDFIANAKEIDSSVDIMSILRNTDEVVNTLGEHHVLSYGEEPKIITVQDLMNPIQTTKFTVDTEKIDELAHMVIQRISEES